MVVAMLFLFAVAVCMLTTSVACAVCIDIGGSNSGVVSAAMNTASQIGSLLSPVVVAYLAEWFGNWDIPIHMRGALFFIGAICSTIIDPR